MKRKDIKMTYERDQRYAPKEETTMMQYIRKNANDADNK